MREERITGQSIWHTGGDIEMHDTGSAKEQEKYLVEIIKSCETRGS